MMEIGDLVSGFEDEDGITLHTITSVEEEAVTISVIQYKPTDENFAWAIEQLASLQET